MEKHELVGLTLERLLDHFKSSPESFEYLDSERNPNKSVQPMIVWQPKVQLTDYMGTVVSDPNNNHAVIVSFSSHLDELTCYIFLKSAPDITSQFATKADCVVSSRRWFEKRRGNYKKFMKLKRAIIRRDVEKENLLYLKKLASVFPDTMDKHIT